MKTFNADDFNRIESEFGAWIQRSKDNQWCLSTVGYCTMDQNDAEKAFMKLGFCYDFEKLQVFDKVCGRTITTFKIKS